MGEYKYVELTDKIICCYYNVYNELGYGFLEKVYENALLIEMQRNGIGVEAQQAITVRYKNAVVGEYFCDLLVEQKVIVEIKAMRTLIKENESQLLNYLRATDLEVGLLLNFGVEPQIKRKAFNNSRKG